MDVQRGTILVPKPIPIAAFHSEAIIARTQVGIGDLALSACGYPTWIYAGKLALVFVAVGGGIIQGGKLKGYHPVAMGKRGCSLRLKDVHAIDELVKGLNAVNMYRRQEPALLNCIGIKTIEAVNSAKIQLTIRPSQDGIFIEFIALQTMSL